MELYEATKGFILLFNFDVLRHRLEDGEYTDGAVSVRSVQLSRSLATTAMGLVAHWDGLTEEQGREGGITYEDSAVAYICSFSPKPGKLDPVACVNLGVPPGPLLGLLKAGQDVTLDCGKLVRASDVVAEAAPPTADLVLEVPDMHYLDSLEEAAELVDIPHLRTVFHLSPSEVVRSPRYRSWMAALGSHVSHVLINEDSCGLGLPDVTAYQHKLRTVRGDLFPALLGAGDPKLGMKELAAELAREVPGAGKVVQASSGLRVTVRPETAGVDLTMALPFLPGVATRELMEGDHKLGQQDRKSYRKGMQEDLEAARTYSPPPETTPSPGRSPRSPSSPTPFMTADNAETPRYWGEKRRKLSEEVDGVSSVTDTSEKRKLSLAEKLKVIDGISPDYPVVTFLGTGSSVPSKYRNVSGILLETAPGSWLLLDCGEGSLGQLVRLKGWEGAMAVLRGLKAVYVSHLHADHHLGAINIILVGSFFPALSNPSCSTGRPPSGRRARPWSPSRSWPRGGWGSSSPTTTRSCSPSSATPSWWRPSTSSATRRRGAGSRPSTQTGRWSTLLQPLLHPQAVCPPVRPGTEPDGHLQGHTLPSCILSDPHYQVFIGLTALLAEGADC